MKLDQIYIISLHSSKNRQSRMKKWIPDNERLVKWWLVKRDSLDPKRGVFTSHTDILKDAKSKGYSYVLILEDDTVPIFPLEYILGKIENFLNNQPKKWNHLMLGYFPFRCRETNRPDLTSIKCAAGAHAYVVNVNNIKHVPTWNGTQIDDIYFCDGKAENVQFAKLNSRGVYGHKPILINQRSEQSLINDFHTIPQKVIEMFGNDSAIKNSEHANLVILSMSVIFILLPLLIFVPLLIAWDFDKVGTNVIYGCIGIIILITFIFSIIFSIDEYKYHGCEMVD
jgi:hypothetical protein